MLTRRLSAFLLSLACASSALAGEGWYVGAGGLYTALDANLKYTETSALGTPSITFDVNKENNEGGGE